MLFLQELNAFTLTWTGEVDSSHIIKRTCKVSKDNWLRQTKNGKLGKGIARWCTHKNIWGTKITLEEFSTKNRVVLN